MSDQWVPVALEEYKTLRQESLSAIEQMQRTLQIGLVAIGVLTGFGVDAVETGVGAQAGLAIFTPIVAALVIALRLDELLRAVNAGGHIAVLEQRIAARLDDGSDPPLTWESTIQIDFDPRDDRIRHGATAVILFAATAPAVVLGVVKLGDDHVWEALLVIAVVALIAALTRRYHHYMLARVARRHERARDEVMAFAAEE